MGQEILLTMWRDWASQHLAPDTDLIHPSDAAIVHRMKSHHIARIEGWSQFQADPMFGSTTDRRLHLRLMPQPFIGDVARAKVVILLMNPGLAPVDYYAEFEAKEFREELRRNLVDGRTGTSHPFLFLDPKWAWTGGYRWWHEKLKPIFDHAAKEPRARAAAQQRIAQRLAVLELIPYHSKNGPASSLAWRLETKKAAVLFAHDYVVPRANRGEVSVIVARQSRQWDLGVSNDHPHITDLSKSGLTRRAWLPPDSDAGRMLLESLD